MEEEYNRIRQIIDDMSDFNYAGKLNMEISKKLILQIESFIQEKYDKGSIRRRIYFVFVKMLQNAHKHGIKDNKIDVCLKHENQHLYIFTQNSIDSNKGIELINRINRLNYQYKNSSDLKKFRHEQIFLNLENRESLNGIGLIEILYKSKNKILYNLEKIDDQNSKISLIATIDNGN